MSNHECHVLGGGMRGGKDQVPLVVPILVVDDNHRPPGLDGGDGHAYPGRGIADGLNRVRWCRTLAQAPCCSVYRTSDHNSERYQLAAASSTI
jgi:hypothetical protein